MQIGSMSKYLSYRTKTRLADGQGGNRAYPTHSRYLWGSVEPTTGSKRWEAQQVIHGVTHVITTHWFSGYDEQAEFVWDGRTFKVKGVINVKEANKELIWTCKEDSE